jgi:hypothetical protein
MAYNTKKGTQHTGDIQFEGDPVETQIDFEDDYIALKTGGDPRLVISGASGDVGIGTVSLAWILIIIQDPARESGLKKAETSK